jgi:dihydroorotase-like cyclic amidohydrolase
MLGLEHVASLTFEALGGTPDVASLLFEVLSRGPARIAQLRRSDVRRRLSAHGGALVTGEDANVVVFDPHARWRVRSEDLQSRAKNTPYDGRELSGRVRTTVAKGRLIVNEGLLV